MPDGKNTLDRDTFRIDCIGECKIMSPLKGEHVHFTTDDSCVLLDKFYSDLKNPRF